MPAARRPRAHLRTWAATEPLVQSSTGSEEPTDAAIAPVTTPLAVPPASAAAPNALHVPLGPNNTSGPPEPSQQAELVAKAAITAVAAAGGGYDEPSEWPTARILQAAMTRAPESSPSSDGDMAKPQLGKGAAARALTRRWLRKLRGQQCREQTLAPGDGLVGQAYGGQAGAGVRRQRLAPFRTIRIWALACSLYLREQRARALASRDPERASRIRYQVARTALREFLRLGPTFIKLGQLLSTRVDLLSKEYIEVLAQLQDDVAPFPSHEAVRIVERNLNGSLADLFERFDEQPIAAASLGQVHRARLNGQEVVVKVQRPNLRSLFDNDLKVLRILAVVAAAFDRSLDGTDRDWLGIYEDNKRLLYREIDYVREAHNCERFRNNFAKEPWVKVPTVFWERVAPEVLTMEFVPGIKISNLEAIEAAGLDRQILAKRSAESYMTQLCRHGFFHCDPHPGNVACDNAVPGGRLIYYDFGMMDEIPEKTRKGFVRFVFGVYENDAKEVCAGATEMEILRTDYDRFSMELMARSFLDQFQSTLRTPGMKWENELDAEEQRAIRKRRRTQIGNELFTVGEDKPFRFPPAFTFVFRAFTTLDGIGKGLDPQYDIARLAQPFLKELVDLRDGSYLASVARTVGQRLGWRPTDLMAVVKQPRNVAAAATTVRELEEGKIKLRVRALEAEKALAEVQAAQTSLLASVVLASLLNLAVTLMVVPQVGLMVTTAGATDAAAAVATAERLQRIGSWTLRGVLAAGAWVASRQYLRLRRLKVGAYEPGQLQL